MGMNGLLMGLGQGLQQQGQMMYQNSIEEARENKRANIERLRAETKEKWHQKEFDQRADLAKQRSTDAVASNTFKAEQNQLDRSSREKIAGMRGQGGGGGEREGLLGNDLAKIDKNITEQYMKLFGDGMGGVKENAPPFGEFRNSRLSEYGVTPQASDGGDGGSIDDDIFSRLINQSKEPGMVGKALQFGSDSISQGPPREKIKATRYQSGQLPQRSTGIQPIPQNARGRALR